MNNQQRLWEGVRIGRDWLNIASSLDCATGKVGKIKLKEEEHRITNTNLKSWDDSFNKLMTHMINSNRMNAFTTKNHKSLSRNAGPERGSKRGTNLKGHQTNSFLVHMSTLVTYKFSSSEISARYLVDDTSCLKW